MRLMVPMPMTVMAVIVMPVIVMRLGAVGAEKGHEHQPPAVEAGEAGGDHQEPEGRGTADIGHLNHRVFRQEAGKAIIGQRDAHPGDRQRADHHGPEGQRDFLPQTAIVAHVLLMVGRMDDRTCPKEQHGLEEGVREEVEHRHRIGTKPGGHEHVPELRHGRIGDHALDVVLHQTDRRGDKGGQGSQHGDKGCGRRRIFINRRHAADEEHACGHHGCGMDQRRHRGRAFHGVRQPSVQEQLRRFAHRPDEQEDTNQVGRVPVSPQEMQVGFSQRRGCGKDIVKLDAVGQIEQRKDAQSKTKVAHAVDHKGLDRGSIGGGLAVVEADQKVGGDAHAFPAKEHLHKVVRRHQREHGKGKERQIGKEARPVRLIRTPVVVMGHVAERIQVHERRDRVDHNQHDRGQPVNPDAPFGRQSPAFDKAQDGDLLGLTVKGQEDDPRQDRRQKHQSGGQDLRRTLANETPAKAAQNGPDQRSKENDLSHCVSLSSR